MRFLFVMLAALMPLHAYALTQASIPPKFGIPWGNSAGASYIRSIPQGSQIGIQNCAASLTDGWPPLTFVPAAAGGCPPFGQDFNGILKQITQWSQWQAAGGPVVYDGTLSSNIGGYPKGAVLQSAVLVGRLWLSTADNNTTNPDSTTSANWTTLPGMAAPGSFTTTISTTAPPGTVSANGLTVGNASSNATSRANADTYWLFSFLWTNCASCTLYNSSGGVIAKGTSAAADYSANSAIATVNMNGVGQIGADSQSGTTTNNLAGVPVTSGSRTVPGSVLGQNLHTITLGETPSGITSIGTISGQSLSFSGSNSWGFPVTPTTANIGTSVVNTTSPAAGNFPTNSAGAWGAINLGGIAVSSASVNVSSANTGGNLMNDVQLSVVVYYWLSL